jgi:hypothetical protein
LTNDSFIGRLFWYISYVALRNTLHNVKEILLLAACSVIGLSLMPEPGYAQAKLYRWVDKDGVVRYTDTIPPEYADRDRDLLNAQGVVIGFEEGEITAEERAEMERLAALEAAAQEARDTEARRDRMLLDTYLSVGDIEDLRDRRLELIDSQIKVTEFYLSNLHRRLDSLERESRRFAPLNDREDASPIPQDLALDISRTETSITLYEQTLSQIRKEQLEMHASFAADIERFKLLRGG